VDELSSSQTTSLPANERILYRSTGEATLFDDEVMRSYTAGFIASSRSKEGSDDRGVAYLALLESLPAFHVRLHHAIYASLRDSVRSGMLGRNNWRQGIFMAPIADLSPVLASEEDPELIRDLVGDALPTFVSLGLIEAGWSMSYGADHVPTSEEAPADRFAIRCMATLRGKSLFEWAHGRGREVDSIFADALPEPHSHGERAVGSSRYWRAFGEH
jgi:hypothetical protein